MASLLNTLGLARAEHVRSLGEQLAAAKTRLGELKGQLERANTEATHWKVRAEETAKRLAAAEEDAERWKAKQLGLRGKFELLAESEQHVTLAREHMLALETKLDIVEGAIDELDRRTRDVLSSRATTPGSRDGGGHGD